MSWRHTEALSKNDELADGERLTSRQRVLLDKAVVQEPFGFWPVDKAEVLDVLLGEDAADDGMDRPANFVQDRSAVWLHIDVSRRFTVRQSVLLTCLRRLYISSVMNGRAACRKIHFSVSVLSFSTLILTDLDKVVRSEANLEV